MNIEVKDVQDNYVILVWEAFVMTVWERAPLSFEYHGGGYFRYPPKAVRAECYRIGRGILSERKKRKEKKLTERASFIGDLFTNEQEV